jgi:predicted permease
MSWVRQLFARRRMPIELSDEIRAHLEQKVEVLVAGGMPRKDAEAAARREFGNVTLTQEDARAVWRWTWIEDFLADVRYALRMLRKNAAFSAVAILILALGIGVNTAVFSVVHAVLLRPLPYRDPGKLAMLWVTDTRTVISPVSDGSTSYRDFLEWKREARSFEDVAPFYKRGWSVLTLTAGDEPEKVQGAFVAANFFALLGAEPQLGRTFTEEDLRRRERLVILSQALWQMRFGGSADVLGREIQINGANWRVVGVMPEQVRFPFVDVKLWAPFTTNPFEEPSSNDPLNLNRPQSVARLQVLARLKWDVPLRDAQAEMDTIAARLAREHPDTDKTLGVRVRPLEEYVAGEMRKPLWLLSLCVLMVLLIACANLATLFLARSVARRKELAMRTALGASRWRIVRQLLTESALVGILGGGAGVLLAKNGMAFLVALAPVNVPRLDEVHIDPAVLAFSFVLALACGISFGLAPARRFSAADPHEELKTGQRGTGGKTLRAEGLLVGAQFALSLVLLASAGLLIRSFVDLLEVDPGFRPEHILTMQLQFADPDAVPPAQIAAYYKNALERVRQIPAVQAAGLAGNIFSLEENRNHALRQVEGHAPEPESSWTPLVWTQVSGDYFRAMAIPLLEGRYFTEQDGPDAPPVVIINQMAAKRYWPGEDPIGKRLKGFDPRGHNDEWVTVVGLVADMRSHGLERAAMCEIYEVQGQRGEATPNLIVRTSTDPLQLAQTIRSTVHAVDNSVIISNVSTMQDVLREQMAPRRFQAWLMGIFSGLALLLAAAAVYGVMHYFVVQRIPEIGVRMALGAGREDIVALLIGRAARFVGPGLAAGLVLAFWAGSLIKRMLFGVSHTDPVSFAGALALLVIAALAATYFPARRATKVDPLVALRYE